VKHFEVRASRVVQPEGLPKEVTHGGYIWVRSCSELPQSMEALSYSSFERYTTGVFPTRYSIKDVSLLESQLLIHPALVSAVLGMVVLRLHVYDADRHSNAEFLSELSSTLLEHGGFELSPTGFHAVLVAVRIGGLLEWELLSPADYAMIKKCYSEDSAVCRAEHKLKDALEFLDNRGIVVDRAHPALDVGSSPGGWTEALLDHGFANVVAIDPGKMSDSLMASRGQQIQHLEMQAQEAGARLQGQQFSMLVCDVNKDLRMILNDMLLPMLPLLAIGAPLVLTMKMPKRGKTNAMSEALKHARIVLAGCEQLEIHHFLGNTAHERTLVGIWRNAGNGVEETMRDGLKAFYSFDIESGWQASLLSLESWVGSNSGQLPMLYARDKAERELAKWVLRQTKQHASSSLRGGWSVDRVDSLERHSWWSWASPQDEFLIGLRMLQDWVAANDGLPDQVERATTLHDDCQERRAFLARWMIAQRHAKLLDSMTLEHQAILNACPHWTWQFDWSNHQGSCIFPATLASNQYAAIDRALGPRFECSCGLFFVCRTQVETCREKHA